MQASELEAQPHIRIIAREEQLDPAMSLSFCSLFASLVVIGPSPRVVGSNPLHLALSRFRLLLQWEKGQLQNIYRALLRHNYTFLGTYKVFSDSHRTRTGSLPATKSSQVISHGCKSRLDSKFIVHGFETHPGTYADFV